MAKTPTGASGARSHANPVRKAPMPSSSAKIHSPRTNLAPEVAGPRFAGGIDGPSAPGGTTGCVNQSISLLHHLELLRLIVPSIHFAPKVVTSPALRADGDPAPFAHDSAAVITQPAHLHPLFASPAATFANFDIEGFRHDTLHVWERTFAAPIPPLRGVVSSSNEEIRPPTPIVKWRVGRGGGRPPSPEGRRVAPTTPPPPDLENSPCLSPYDLQVHSIQH